MDYHELELAGIDVNELMGRILNNTRLLKLFVSKFLEDQTFRKLELAIEKGDWKEAEFACHTLKGVFANLSLNALAELSKKQLQLFRYGNIAAAAAMMEEITPKYNTAILHLRLWLAQQ